MIIDCKQIKLDEIEKMKIEFSKLSFVPKLKIIMVGDNHASEIYVRNKRNTGLEVGIDVEVEVLNDKTSEQELLTMIDEANASKDIHGVFVQLPVPDHINEEQIINRIAPEKDVDGFCYVNTGKLVSGIETLRPCTAEAVLSILNSCKISLRGASVVIAGRSNIVGKPLANMLINEGATVTVANSATKNIQHYLENCDVFISAIGIANNWDAKYFDFENAKNMTVIDVGINRNDEGKLCGDVATSEVEPLVKQITSVPGGVGVLTVTHVMKNMLKAVNKEK